MSIAFSRWRRIAEKLQREDEKRQREAAKIIEVQRIRCGISVERILERVRTRELAKALRRWSEANIKQTWREKIKRRDGGLRLELQQMTNLKLKIEKDEMKNNLKSAYQDNFKLRRILTKFESQKEDVTQSTVMNNTQDQNLGIPSNITMKEIEFLAENQMKYDWEFSGEVQRIIDLFLESKRQMEKVDRK